MTKNWIRICFILPLVVLLCLSFTPSVMGFTIHRTTQIDLDQDKSGIFHAPISKFYVDGTDTSYVYEDGSTIKSSNDGVTTQHRSQRSMSDNYTIMSVLSDNSMRYEKYLTSPDIQDQMIGYLVTSLDAQQLNDENQLINQFTFNIEGLLEKDPYSQDNIGTVIDFEGSIQLREDFSYKSSNVTVSLQSGDLGVFVEKNGLDEIDLIPGFTITHEFNEIDGSHDVEINTTSLIESDYCLAEDFITDTSCYRTSNTKATWYNSFDGEVYSINHIFDTMNNMSPIFNSSYTNTVQGYQSDTKFEYYDAQFRLVEETGLFGYNSYSIPNWNVAIATLTKQAILEIIDTSITNGMFSSFRLTDTELEIETISGSSEMTKVTTDFLAKEIRIDQFDSNGNNRLSGVFGIQQDNSDPLTELEFEGYEHFNSQLRYPTLAKPQYHQHTTFSTNIPQEFDEFGIIPNFETLGSMSQLMQLDLQKGLQKTQQILQIISNIAKMNHDTAKAIIRKIGGSLDQTDSFKVIDTITPAEDFVPGLPSVFIGDDFDVANPEGKDIIPIPTESNYRRPILNIDITNLHLTADNIDLALKVTNQYYQTVVVSGEVFSDGKFHSKIHQTQNEIELLIPRNFENSITLKLVSDFLPFGELTLTKSLINQLELDAETIRQLESERSDLLQSSDLDNLRYPYFILAISLVVIPLLKKRKITRY